MRAIILGAGVIGVTSAYYLAKAGHEVVVLERQNNVALETSFANAGEISPGYSSPWAGPGVPRKALKWLAMKYGPLVVRPALDPAMWRWIFAMLGNCNEKSYARNKARMVRLAEYSRDCLDELRRDTAISYDERMQGTLQLFRTQKQLDSTGADKRVLEKFGVPFELLDRQGCIKVEPGLAAVKEKFVGGLRLPHDETGDCFLFTNKLAEMAKNLGVKFQHNTHINHLQANDSDSITGVGTNMGWVEGDCYILALGAFSRLLARDVNLQVPVYPIKGYSLTANIIDFAKAPVSTIMDETYKIAITRLGDRIRVGGTAEVAGYDHRLTRGRRQTLEHSVTDLFPGAGDIKGAAFWSGLRPMTPDGTPLLGRTHFSNLFLNTGHGTLGWTMACGSAKLLSDIISRQKPDIDLDGLEISRYH